MMDRRTFLGAVAACISSSPALADNFPKAGKRGLVVLMGDSFPAETMDLSVQPVATMDSLLSKYLGTQVVNFAIGGTTAALRNDKYWSPLSFSAFATTIRAVAEGGPAEELWKPHRVAAAVINKKAEYQVDQLSKFDWSAAGALIWMYGHNDGVANTPMGKESGKGSTFKGAVNGGVRDILTVHPHVKPLLVTPTYRDRFVAGTLGKARIEDDILVVTKVNEKPKPVIKPGYSVYMEDIYVRTKIVADLGGNRFRLDRSVTLSERDFAVADDATNGDVFKNKAGLRLPDYVDAIRQTGARLHVPVIDAYAESGFNHETAPRLTGDGLHPSPKVGLYELAHFIGRGAARHLV